MFRLQYSFAMLLVALCAFNMAHAYQMEVEQPGGQRYTIEIGCRSYDGTMWLTNAGTNEAFDVAAYNADSDAYISSLPEERRPVNRLLKDNTVEPDILDDGNCWVAILDPEDSSQRRAYLITNDGFHDVCTRKDFVHQVEDINGADYVKRIQFQTVPTNYEAIGAIAAQLAGQKKINEFNAAYFGTDFVIDLVTRLVSQEAREQLMSSSNEWPRPVQLLDKYHRSKLGRSAFRSRGIPLGKTPIREHMSHTSYANENRQTAVRPQA